MNEARDGARDFDFLTGRWRVRNRRLRERLKGSTGWEEFEATNVARPLLNGLANEDEYRTDHWEGFVGMSFRYFDPATKRWSIYWADSVRGVLEPPVVGSFSGDTGVFLGADSFEGRPIRVRFIWSRGSTSSPRWEQAFSEDDGKTWETNWTMDMTRDDRPAKEFPVVEFRRYTLEPGEREHFVRSFEAWFPEAFQQLGALALGQFRERDTPSRFTWFRGFPNLDARAVVNTAFYSGSLWKEHAAAMNDRLVDSDDVLLLHPLTPDRGIPVLPAVDPVSQTPPAGSVVVAQLFTVDPGSVEAFAREAEGAFAGYRAAGARESGLLVTLDVPNNYPRLPIRTDGPHLLWLGTLEGEEALAGFRPLAERSAKALSATGLLRAAPELIVLDPTRRSRLR